MEPVKSQRVAKLNGFDNYDVWAQDMANLLKYDSLWGITSGKELEPTIPPPPAKSTEGDNTPTAATSADREYQMMLERKQEEITRWNRGNDKACSLIMLTAEAGPRVHIQKLDSAKEIWDTLQRSYQRSNRTTKHNALKLMAQARQVDYTSLEEYADAIKGAFARRAQVGYPLPEEALADFFLMGLNEDLKLYTFNLLANSNASKVDLDIDTLLSALNDHEALHETEKSRTLAAKTDRNPSKSPLNKSKKDKKSKQSKNSCEHCKNKGHTSKDCYFLHPELRPEDWQPRGENKKLLKENTTKSDSSKDSATKIIRSMKVAINKLSNPQIDHNWCIDSGAENHICHNRALFETYHTITGRHVTTANNEAIPILGRGSVLLTVLLEGQEEQVRITNVYHFPELHYNLLGVGTLESKGFSISIKEVEIQHI